MVPLIVVLRAVGTALAWLNLRRSKRRDHLLISGQGRSFQVKSVFLLYVRLIGRLFIYQLGLASDWDDSASWFW